MVKATHGLSHTPLYNIWRSIRQRCFNTNSQNYPHYGARGITMWGDWVNNFKAFHDYVSGLPNYGVPGLSLDRIENDGNYEPSNLRWATGSEQRINSRAILRGTITGHKNIRVSLNKFRVALTRGGIKHDLGTFNTIDEAIMARDKFLQKR